MEVNIRTIPREFTVGVRDEIVLKDCAAIYLNPNEQVTFITKDNKEYDVCYKDWGFYATPSVNGRLVKFGFKTVLIENPNHMKYILLVEDGKEALFNEYISNENYRIIQWLNSVHNYSHCLCDMSDFELIYTYTQPPAGEILYPLQGEAYYRELRKCKYCGHFMLKHNYNLESIYRGQYAELTYKDKLADTFNKIIKLPIDQSDNNGRIDNIIQFCKKRFEDIPLSVLDVGSGLCVFLYLLSQKTNWSVLALDPDPVQAQHAQTVCNVTSTCCDFFSLNLEKKFDLITFNKVLEHVRNPIQMLSRAKKHLTEHGLVYIELPDGTAALKDSIFREEFFIEHYHAFSMSSISLLIEKSGLVPLDINRVREPSGKYTLRAFCY